MNEHELQENSRPRRARQYLEAEDAPAHDHKHEHHHVAVEAEPAIDARHAAGALSRPSSGNFLDAGFEDLKEEPRSEIEADIDVAQALRQLGGSMADFGILPQREAAVLLRLLCEPFIYSVLDNDGSADNSFTEHMRRGLIQSLGRSLVVEADTMGMRRE